MARIKHSKKKIMDVLKKHPGGLTIGTVAKLSRMSRITATKYIQGLIGEGKIRERRIGAARLLFSKKSFMKRVNEEKILRKIRKITEKKR